MIDDAVIAAARTGDATAWRTLFVELSPAIAGYVRLQGASEVDDVVSEVFLAVSRTIGTFVGTPTQFRSWLFVIAHGKVVDERRRRSRRPVEVVAPASDDRSEADSADRALEVMSTERVAEICAALVPDQRDVLLLRLVGDLTVEQVAAVLDKSVGAVKALQRRGLAAVQRNFFREGVPL